MTIRNTLCVNIATVPSNLIYMLHATKKTAQKALGLAQQQIGSSLK